MATDLHERLADLAAHRPPASAPPDLWQRGVRRQRVSRLGSAVLAAVLVVLVGLGGWTWHQARPVQPSDSPRPARVPDRLYQPSSWTPSFDGPPGALVAVIPTVKSSWWHGDRNGFVGVTAADGQYGFLRLDHVAEGVLGDPVSLSPDGRRLALWVTGPVSGRAIGSPVAGVDVYDLVTGSVVRWRPTTVHGLATDQLQWAGDDTLLLGFGQYVSGSASEGYANDYATYRWDLGTGEPRLFEPVPGVSATSVTATGRRYVLSRRGRELVGSLDSDTPPTSVRGLGKAHHSVWSNPSGTRLVYVAGSSDSGPLFVGDVPGNGGRLRDGHRVKLDGREVYSILGWLGEKWVVVEATGGPPSRVHLEVDAVDVTTGRVELLTTPEVNAQVAADLLSGPSVHASAPPHPRDPRSVAALTVFGGGAVLLFLVAYWRSRARRP